MTSNSTPATVFLFAGQGSQYFQMGRELYERDPVFSREMREMDALVCATGAPSVLGQLYGPRSKSDDMDDIRLSHPAIYMVEVALARALIAAGCRPDLTLGASLGTVAAAVVAGQIARDDGLSLVVSHAQTIARDAPAGGMLAILAPLSVAAEELQRGEVEVAARHFDEHFVVAGPVDALSRLEKRLHAADVIFQRLPVPYPFHSRWIEPLQASYAAPGPAASLRRSDIPLVCCATGEALHRLPAGHLWRVARLPIDFQRTVLHLETAGPHRYLDLSPSGSLATFLKYLLPRDGASTWQAVLSPYGADLERMNEAVKRWSP